MHRQQISRQRHGGPGSGPRHSFETTYKDLSPSSDKPQLLVRDFESTLDWLGYTKYEGLLAPNEEPFRAATWINEETGDKLYIVTPRADDHKAIQRYRDELNVLLKRAPGDNTASIRRGADGVKISVYFAERPSLDI